MAQYLFKYLSGLPCVCVVYTIETQNYWSIYFRKYIQLTSNHYLVKHILLLNEMYTDKVKPYAWSQ